MAIIQRFSTIRRGGIIFAGNTAGLAPVNASGVYSVSAIPALISNPSSQSSDTNHAGWTLAVVYEDSSQPLRSLTLWCGASAVSLDAGSTDISVAGFLTPDSLPVSGKLFVSAQEGDAVIGGDSLLFGANAGALQTLSGHNNPADNFFASQINNSSGLPDTSGTFGTRNASAAALAATGAEPVAECVTCPDGGVIITQSSVFNGSIRT